MTGGCILGCCFSSAAEESGAAMKKVLLANDIQDLVVRKASFLGRSDITLFTAATNDELFRTHGREKADLIITRLDLPGIPSEEMFRAIRESDELRGVSTIIICKDTLLSRERCGRCMANAVFTLPVDVPRLFVKAHELLDIAPRQYYRAALAVGIQGQFKDRPLPFWTENISVTGMLIKSQEPLSRGDGIFFSFFLPDGRHVSGYGEVTRTDRSAAAHDDYRYGVKYTNVEPEAEAAIKAVVEQNRQP